MKLTHVSVCGFRGYREQVRIDFAPGFNIIDGRNGVGKSTIFDAVEYALTGDLSKYAGATASGQSVADYIWWIGEVEAPKDRFVEVGFSGDQGAWVVRRTPLDPKNFVIPSDLTAALADPELAPDTPLRQLCASTIIRDEHIAGLSLDLKETERYALLRQAIGATDAETWIQRVSGDPRPGKATPRSRSVRRCQPDHRGKLGDETHRRTPSVPRIRRSGRRGDRAPAFVCRRSIGRRGHIAKHGPEEDRRT